MKSRKIVPLLLGLALVFSGVVWFSPFSLFNNDVENRGNSSAPSFASSVGGNLEQRSELEELRRVEQARDKSLRDEQESFLEQRIKQRRNFSSVKETGLGQEGLEELERKFNELKMQFKAQLPKHPSQ